MKELSTLQISVDAFLENTGMAPTTFGRRAVGDANLVARVRSGANLTLRTVQRVYDYISLESTQSPGSAGRGRSAGAARGLRHGDAGGVVAAAAGGRSSPPAAALATASGAGREG